MSDDDLLRAFVRGELTGDQVAEVETLLDLVPSVRERVARFAAEVEASGAPSAPDELVEGPARLVPGGLLGEGGMAVVRSGIQTNLGREVAIKSVRGPERTERSTARLLREARLTGLLEHPNIVGVHDVLRDADGALQVVLQRIDGSPWSAVMFDDAAIRDRFFADDALDWNLGVLSLVCQALAFAHGEGVVHRDIKPGNVMVGSFGRVYLLDWGVAGTWDDREGRNLPRLGDMPVAGTLAYMAPEQLEAAPELQGPWTDVYLLGATLFELLTRSPPYPSRKKGQTQPHRECAAELGSDVPQELKDLIARAMHADPAERMGSAESFRRAIEAFRRHRGSQAVAARADRTLEEEDSAAPGDPAAASDRRLAEAEYGYRAALDLWPANEHAIDGLRRVEVARARAALTRGVTTRGRLLAVIGPLWFLGWLAFAIWPVSSVSPLMVFVAGYWLIGSVLLLARLRIMLSSRLNRTIAVGTCASLIASFSWLWGSQQAGMTLAQSQAGLLLVWGLGSALISVSVDLRSLPMGLLNLGAFVYAVTALERTPVLLAVCAGGALVVLGAVNRLVRRSKSTIQGSSILPP